jgi:hypothetical protein
VRVTSTDARCPTCGRELDSHDRHVRFGLPDPVLAIPEEEREDRTWQTEDMMQVQGCGAFIRALLPVKLTGDHSVTFGIWLAVHPDDLQRAFRVWWAPEYQAFTVDAWLANALPIWGLLTAPVRARVRREGEVPYVVSSHDQDMARVLTSEWDHERILSALPHWP